MPSKTAKQHRFMEMIAHGGKPKGGKGPSKAVAKEFVAADRGKKFDDSDPSHDNPIFGKKPIAQARKRVRKAR